MPDQTKTSNAKKYTLPTHMSCIVLTSENSKRSNWIRSSSNLKVTVAPVDELETRKSENARKIKTGTVSFADRGTTRFDAIEVYTSLT